MSSETIEKDSKKKLVAAEAESDDAEERDADERDADDEDDSEEESKPETSIASDSPKRKIVINRPSSAKMIWTLTKREIGGYLNSAITYIVIATSMVAIGWYFFFYKGGFWQVDRASMTRMFDALPLALCFLTIPLFTMRSLSDEKRVGTIELLITMPVKDSEVILGKFFGSLAMVSLQILLLAAYPLVMWSSFTESQILSYFATMITLVALYAIGFSTVVEFLQGWPGDAIAFVSLHSRFEPFARGLIDSRAVIYFLSLTTLGLVVAFRSLESRKWS